VLAKGLFRSSGDKTANSKSVIGLPTYSTRTSTSWSAGKSKTYRSDSLGAESVPSVTKGSAPTPSSSRALAVSTNSVPSPPRPR
jgi:hypothetical protein